MKYKEIKTYFIDKRFAIKVIMDCRTISVYKFRKRLEFR